MKQFKYYSSKDLTYATQMHIIFIIFGTLSLLFPLQAMENNNSNIHPNDKKQTVANNAGQNLKKKSVNKNTCFAHLLFKTNEAFPIYHVLKTNFNLKNLDNQKYKIKPEQSEDHLIKAIVSKIKSTTISLKERQFQTLLKSYTALYRFFSICSQNNIRINDINEYATQFSVAITQNSSDLIQDVRQLFSMTDFNLNAMSKETSRSRSSNCVTFFMLLSRKNIEESTLTGLVKLFLENNTDLRTNTYLMKMAIVQGGFDIIPELLEKIGVGNLESGLLNLAVHYHRDVCFYQNPNVHGIDKESCKTTEKKLENIINLFIQYKVNPYTTNCNEQFSYELAYRTPIRNKVLNAMDKYIDILGTQYKQSIFYFLCFSKCIKKLPKCLLISIVEKYFIPKAYELSIFKKKTTTLSTQLNNDIKDIHSIIKRIMTYDYDNNIYDSTCRLYSLQIKEIYKAWFNQH